jgi:hypothetical protein
MADPDLSMDSGSTSETTVHQPAFPIIESCSGPQSPYIGLEATLRLPNGMPCGRLRVPCVVSGEALAVCQMRTDSCSLVDVYVRQRCAVF